MLFRPIQRGVSRSSRTRDGMRWTRSALLTNSADADDEVVWSRRLEVGVKPAEFLSAGDGVKKA
jgi:hypothetical protein